MTRLKLSEKAHYCPYCGRDVQVCEDSCRSITAKLYQLVSKVTILRGNQENKKDVFSWNMSPTVVIDKTA